MEGELFKYKMVITVLIIYSKYCSRTEMNLCISSLEQYGSHQKEHIITMLEKLRLGMKLL